MTVTEGTVLDSTSELHPLEAVNGAPQKAFTSAKSDHQKLEKNWPPVRNSFGMIGQESICSLLDDLVEFSKHTGRRMGDRLLVGPPATGKSTLARALARRLVDGGCVLFNAADCRQPKEFIAALGDHGLFDETDEAEGQGDEREAFQTDAVSVTLVKAVIFIDEVHALSRPMRAWLLSVLDDSRTASCGGILYRFTNVTFLLATTDPGRLHPAFLSRCEPLNLRPYRLDELAGIVSIHAADFLEGQSLDRAACFEIAVRMQANPRRSVRALQYVLIPHAHAELRRAGQQADSQGIASWLKSENIASFYDRQGVDLNGLDQQARSFLNHLHVHGTTPENRIKQALSLTTDADFRSMEEYLLRLGLVTVTQKGRALTDLGVTYLKKPSSLRNRIASVA